MGKKHLEVQARKLRNKDSGLDRGRSEGSSSSIFDSREDLLKAVGAVLVILFMILSAFIVML